MKLDVKTWKLRLTNEWCACLRSVTGCDVVYGVGDTEREAHADLETQAERMRDALTKWLEGAE